MLMLLNMFGSCLEKYQSSLWLKGWFFSLAPKIIILSLKEVEHVKTGFVFCCSLFLNKNFTDIICPLYSQIKAGPGLSSFLLRKDHRQSYLIIFFSMLGRERAGLWRLEASPPFHWLPSGFQRLGPCNLHYTVLKLHIDVFCGTVANLRYIEKVKGKTILRASHKWILIIKVQWFLQVTN